MREMAIALAKQLAGLRVGNILMIGSSGTGKTTLMRAVESYLAADPELAGRSAVVRIHANVLGEEAERGRPGEAVLARLLSTAPASSSGRRRRSPSCCARAGSGLVFVDEVDKIRARVGEVPNVAGIRAQEALLTLIENEAVALELPAWAGGGTAVVDSSGLLFVCAGAFEGLYDAVYDRVTIGKDRGALQPVTVVEGGKVREQMVFQLRALAAQRGPLRVRHEPAVPVALRRRGAARRPRASTSWCGSSSRLPTPPTTRPAPTSTAAASTSRSRPPPCAASPLEAARQPRLGARALKEVFRRVIRDYEFDPAEAASGGALLLDLDEVEAALALAGAASRALGRAALSPLLADRPQRRQPRLAPARPRPVRDQTVTDSSAIGAASRAIVLISAYTCRAAGRRPAPGRRRRRCRR